MNPTEFKFRVINNALTGILVVGVILAWFEFRGDHDQRRREYTMHLYDEWRMLLDLSDARITLEMVRDGQLNSADLLKGTEEYTIEVGGNNISHEGVLEMRQHIISVLNLFEQVIVAGRDNIGDAEMIRSYFGVAIVDHYNALAPFIGAWRTSMGRQPGWTILERTVEDWRAPGVPRRPSG